MFNAMEGEEKLIIAIFYQAYKDAISKGKRGVEPKYALQFINAKNKGFRWYCSLIGLEPTWVERKIKQAIREVALSPKRPKTNLFSQRKSPRKAL